MVGSRGPDRNGLRTQRTPHEHVIERRKPANASHADQTRESPPREQSKARLQVAAEEGVEVPTHYGDVIILLIDNLEQMPHLQMPARWQRSVLEVYVVQPQGPSGWKPNPCVGYAPDDPGNGSGFALEEARNGRKYVGFGRFKGKAG